MLKPFFLSFFLLFSSLYSDLPVDLAPYEVSLYSQNGEDGILSKIFQLIPPSLRYCVDVGASDGITENNTYLFRLQGWDGVLFDRAYENQDYKLYKEFVTAENINALFDQHRVPFYFGLLSIDVGYNDFHLWNALDQKYCPSVVVIQYNSTYGSEEDKVVKYLPFYCGDGSDYFGASILALYKLGRSKGYSLVYAESSGRNLFFIRNELLQQVSFQQMNEVQNIYRFPAYSTVHIERKNRTFTSAEERIR